MTEAKRNKNSVEGLETEPKENFYTIEWKKEKIIEHCRKG